MNRLICLVFILCFTACADKRSSEPVVNTNATVIFTGAPQQPTVHVEIADTQKRMDIGLMKRPSMAADAGMVFVFPTEKTRQFWMKDTWIPLDMIFVDNNQTIVGIVHHAPPMTEQNIGVTLPSRYVIEVNGGFAKRELIEMGQKVIFYGVPKKEPQ